ncbi:hypothetical protein H7X87_00295 [Acetobacteraceae bacterium]|nr:hypothetical protein [Candidatus Parcubacteria bacterium]
MTKPFIFAVLGLIIIAGGAYVVYAKPFTLPWAEERVVCTADAQQCPDGSYVGRTGPNCEFASCPQAVGAEKDVVTVGIGQTGESILDIKITPLEVLEDSRCPIDVQCIQAGTVRLRAQMVDGMGTGTEIFTLGQTITGEVASITLLEVKPARESGSPVTNSQYQFVFEVTKR